MAGDSFNLHPLIFLRKNGYVTFQIRGDIKLQFPSTWFVIAPITSQFAADVNCTITTLLLNSVL